MTTKTRSSIVRALAKRLNINESHAPIYTGIVVHAMNHDLHDQGWVERRLDDFAQLSLKAGAEFLIQLRQDRDMAADEDEAERGD